MINSIRNKSTLACCLVLGALLPAITVGQDAIYKYKASGGTSKINGQITEVSPTGATIDGKLIPAAEIKRLLYAKEPAGLNQAREQMQDGRFSDAIEELDDLDAASITGPLLQEADFIRAFSTAQLSLRVGSITPQVAGKEIRDFINNHTNSIHLYPAVEQYGKLLFAFGRPDLAAVEFQKLAQCSWLEYQLKGQFQLGKALAEAGDLAQAPAAFNAILAVESNDDLSQTYKLLSKCELARLIGLQGNADRATTILNELIGTESAENSLLFANLYNALGAVYEKAGQLKEARTAYLHTNLLFASEPEEHAEALYHLALIWPQLEETDRANEARDTLKTRYRNSYWAGKL